MGHDSGYHGVRFVSLVYLAKKWSDCWLIQDVVLVTHWV